MCSDLGGRIREARERAAIESQAALARLLEVDKKTISNWERGEIVPKGATLRRLADALGVTVKWLQDGGEYSTRAPQPAPAASPTEPLADYAIRRIEGVEADRRRDAMRLEELAARLDA